ncbi:MAG: thiamine biosynthesis lipoprotein [Lentisphaeria bacterium]
MLVPIVNLNIAHMSLLSLLKPLLFLCAWFTSFSAYSDWYSDTQSIMGTEVNLTLWHENATVAKSAIDAVMAEMRRIDTTLSPYKPESDLSKVNREAGKAPTPISAELSRLIDKSLFYSDVSEGAFDITFASVGRYYDYRSKQKPSDELRETLLKAIDYHHIVLDRNKHQVFFKNPDVYIDLGGIAKGYAVDRASEIMRTYGIEHATVSAGGDSRVLGDRRGRPWIIGIKNPRKATPGLDDSIIRMPLENVAVSTSGDYERYFIDPQSGEHIHHIINPKTGTSAKGVVSVTIIGPRGMDTDPLSTTVFVLGIEKGLALANSLTGFDCVIVDSYGRAHYSDELIAPPVNQHTKPERH